MSNDDRSGTGPHRQPSDADDGWRRDGHGRFGPGNKGGPGGGALSRKMTSLRCKLLAAVSEEDIEAIVQALIAKATEGDVPAAREVLDRCCGKAEALDLAVRLEALEDALEAATGGVGS